MKNTVLTVDGFGVRISVDHGHLVVMDGFASDGSRREIRFPRGRCEVERIIVRASTGSTSLEALDWCNRLAIPIAFVGSDSRLINCLVPVGRSDAPLKRAQGYAALCEGGMQIARDMLRDKFASQAHVLERDFSRLGLFARGAAKVKSVVAEIRRAANALPEDADLRSLLVREGYVARLYWSVLLDSPLPWPDWTRSRIPAHWLAISSRELGATQQVRDATDPLNAILNYAYTLLEVETRVAIHANGLDPELGLLHVDARARESLVCDLVEPVRSTVDQLCLAFCQREGLRSHMFHELRNGVVRLDPDTAKNLTQWIMPQLRKPAADSVAAFAARLRRLTVPYRLEVRVGTDRRDQRSTAQFGTCAYCGSPLTRNGRKYCSRQCTLRFLYETNPPWKASQAALAKLRAEGKDPQHGGEAARKRGEKIAASNRKRARFVTAEEKRIANNERAARYRERQRASRAVEP